MNTAVDFYHHDVNTSYIIDIYQVPGTRCLVIIVPDILKKMGGKTRSHSIGTVKYLVPRAQHQSKQQNNRKIGPSIPSIKAAANHVTLLWWSPVKGAQGNLKAKLVSCTAAVAASLVVWYDITTGYIDCGDEVALLVRTAAPFWGTKQSKSK